MTELRAWHKQPGESKQAYGAFNVWRNLEATERSIPRVVSELSKSRQLLQRWKTEWNWEERAEEWDQEVEVRKLEAHVETKRKMDEEHLKIVRTARNKAVKRLSEISFDTMGLAELRAWLDQFMRWERLILGEPEFIGERRTRVEKADPASIEKEMEELLPIIEEMYRRGDLGPLEEGE